MHMYFCHAMGGAKSVVLFISRTVASTGPATAAFGHRGGPVKLSVSDHMNPQTLTLTPGRAFINGTLISEVRGINLDSRSLEIFLSGRAAIRLYTLNSLMLPIESKRIGTERYLFEGPQLGLYHDTADIREGPFVNHYISRLDIEVTYLSTSEASVKVKGSANLAASSFDPYWYKGSTSGYWEFEASFTHVFRKP